jgi:hypothetical protein
LQYKMNPYPVTATVPSLAKARAIPVHAAEATRSPSVFRHASSSSICDLLRKANTQHGDGIRRAQSNEFATLQNSWNKTRIIAANFRQMFLRVRRLGKGGFCENYFFDPALIEFPQLSRAEQPIWFGICSKELAHIWLGHGNMFHVLGSSPIFTSSRVKIFEFLNACRLGLVKIPPDAGENTTDRRRVFGREFGAILPPPVRDRVTVDQRPEVVLYRHTVDEVVQHRAITADIPSFGKTGW